MRRGATLLECLVALVVSAILLAAIDATLLAQRRAERAGSAARGLRQNVRAAAAILRGELEAMSPARDLLTASDSAIAFHAQRAVGFVCGRAGATVVLDDALLTAQRAPDPARDSVDVFAEGDSSRADDDAWIRAGFVAVRPGRCADGRAGTALDLALPTATADRILDGAPLRAHEVTEYRRYADASGLWWLGVRTPAGAGWASTQPVAGPLAPRGLVLRYLDSTLVPVSPDSAALIDAVLRMLDARPFGVGGTTSTDSLTVRVRTAR